MRKTIAQNMIDVLKKHHRNIIWYGDIDLIEECALLSNMEIKHPQKTINNILNALDRSELFFKHYIYSDHNGKRQKYRCFIMH